MSVTNYYLPLDSNAQSTDLKTEEEYYSVFEEVRSMSTEKNEDSVNHPSHYAGEIECKDAMIQQFGTEKYKIFCQLNAFKYLWRSDMKHNPPDEDLAKAGWYLAEYEALSGNASVAAQKAQEGALNTSDEEVPTKVYEPILGHFKNVYAPDDEEYKAYTQSELYAEMDEDPYERYVCEETGEVYGRLCSCISNDPETIYDFKYNTYWKIEKDDLDGPDDGCVACYVLRPIGSNRTCEEWKLTPEYAKTIMVRECRYV